LDLRVAEEIDLKNWKNQNDHRYPRDNQEIQTDLEEKVHLRVVVREM
jgi:hypothetical protein